MENTAIIILMLLSNNISFNFIFSNLRTFSAVIFGAMSLGQATSFAPNYQKGAAAAGHIKKLINSLPKIDAYSEEGEKPVSESDCAVLCS